MPVAIAHVMVLARGMVLAHVMVLAHSMVLAVSPCYGVSLCQGVSLCYGVCCGMVLAHVMVLACVMVLAVSPCYGVSPCYDVNSCNGVMVFAHVMVLTRDGWWRGSHGLSTRRTRRTKSRGPKGLQLEVGARRAPRLLVYTYFLDSNQTLVWHYSLLEV